MAVNGTGWVALGEGLKQISQGVGRGYDTWRQAREDEEEKERQAAMLALQRQQLQQQADQFAQTFEAQRDLEDYNKAKDYASTWRQGETIDPSQIDPLRKHPTLMANLTPIELLPSQSIGGDFRMGAEGPSVQGALTETRQTAAPDPLGRMRWGGSETPMQVEQRRSAAAQIKAAEAAIAHQAVMEGLDRQRVDLEGRRVDIDELNSGAQRNYWNAGADAFRNPNRWPPGGTGAKTNWAAEVARVYRTNLDAWMGNPANKFADEAVRSAKQMELWNDAIEKINKLRAGQQLPPLTPQEKAEGEGEIRKQQLGAVDPAVGLVLPGVASGYSFNRPEGSGSGSGP